MGAVAGGFFGEIVHALFPSVTASSGAYALVGMAGVVAGATHAPITAIIILFEMTGDYKMILPLMLTCVFATLISNRLNPESIYTLKLSRRGVKLRSGRDIEILASIKVKDIMHTDYITIPHTTPLYKMINIFENTKDDHYMVIKNDNQLLGTLSFQDLRTILSSTGLDHLVIAADLCHIHPFTVYPEDTLDEALKRFAPRDLSAVPVVADKEGMQLLGLLKKEDIYSAYNRKVFGKNREI